MKYSVTAIASILAAIWPWVNGAPWNLIINPRGVVCPFDQGGNTYSIVTEADDSGKVRWNIFATNSDDIALHQLAFFSQPQPDSHATFVFLPTTDSDLIFFVQDDNNDGLKVAATEFGFAGHPFGSPLQFNCSFCDTAAVSGTPFASGCAIEVTHGGVGTGKCAAFTGGTTSAVALNDCDLSLQSDSNKNQFFTVFIQA